MTAEQEEKVRLADCLGRIDANLQLIGTRLRDYAQDVKETTTYMWEARRDLDHIDKVAMRQSIEQKSRSAEMLHEQRVKLTKLRRSPYFGRLDFARDGGPEQGARAIYVGVHDFRDETANEAIVFDWRAPISSMFYDHEIGPASYEAPSRTISGQVELKRQFSIRNGHMEFMLESSVNIVDDKGSLTPVYFGSALRNFGVRDLLDALIAFAPPPQSQKTVTRTIEPNEPAMTGLVHSAAHPHDPQIQPVPSLPRARCCIALSPAF